MPIIRRSDCVLLPIVVCPVVAAVMLEIRVARYVHCVHTARHPTLQYHNSYNRTDNYRQWNAVGSPDDGHKDAWNMLRYYWLPINHYLLLMSFSVFPKAQKREFWLCSSVRRPSPLTTFTHIHYWCSSQYILTLCCSLCISQIHAISVFYMR